MYIGINIEMKVYIKGFIIRGVKVILNTSLHRIKRTESVALAAAFLSSCSASGVL